MSATNWDCPKCGTLNHVGFWNCSICKEETNPRDRRVPTAPLIETIEQASARWNRSSTKPAPASEAGEEAEVFACRTFRRGSAQYNKLREGYLAVHASATAALKGRLESVRNALEKYTTIDFFDGCLERSMNDGPKTESMTGPVLICAPAKEALATLNAILGEMK